MGRVWIVEWKYRHYTPTKWTPSGLPYRIDAFPTREEALTVCRGYQSAAGNKSNFYRVSRYDRKQA